MDLNNRKMKNHPPSPAKVMHNCMDCGAVRICLVRLALTQLMHYFTCHNHRPSMQNEARRVVQKNISKLQ